MEVVSPNPNQTPASLSVPPALYNARADVDEVLLKQAAANASDKAKGKPFQEVNIDLSEAYKSISITAKQLVDKLNELLADELPDGIQSLKPEQATPEATADRIVRGATAFFDVYARQNPELEGEELLNGFMDTIKGGIEQGYDEAFGILEDLGAFEFKGVQDGVEETRALIDKKLIAFESEMRTRLGLEPININEEIAEATSQEIVQQTAKSVSLAA